MRYRVTKLRRYKLCATVLNLIALPIRLPLFLLYSVGELADRGLNLIDKVHHVVIHWTIRMFKFDEVADRQYKINKDKFKED